MEQYLILLCNDRYEDDSVNGVGDPSSANKYTTVKEAEDRITFMEYPNACIINWPLKPLKKLYYEV